MVRTDDKYNTYTNVLTDSLPCYNDSYDSFTGVPPLAPPEYRVGRPRGPLFHVPSQPAKFITRHLGKEDCQ